MTVSIIIGFIVLAFALIYVQNSRVPALGIRNGQFKPLSSKPNSVSSQANDAAKLVAPLAFKGDKTNSFNIAMDVIQSMPGARVQEQDSDYIYAVFTTPIMKYKDDVEVYFDEVSQQVHFRSASRAGYSDMGVNRKRYKAFSASYKDAALEK